jgi:type IV secretory pathway TraG/TraD family ATPase VirD4
MPRSNPFPERVNPLAPLGELAHWLVGTTIDVALGLAIGMIAARLMRVRHLHWSWAACAFALVALLPAPLAHLAPVLAVAALSASLRSRRWHREDSEAGADLAELAARRRRPADLLRTSANAIELHRRRTRGVEAWFLGEQLILGRDERGGLVSIPFGGSGGGTHTLLVGATGSGKTVTQTWMTIRAIERGMGAIVIDPKGDRDMRACVARAARAADRTFIEWGPEGPWVYNPFAAGSETEIADKLLAGERYTEPHYLRQAQRFLGHVVRALRNADLEVSLRAVVEHLDPISLELLVRAIPEDEGHATHAYLDSLTLRQQADLAGVRDRLAILAESDVGRWLDPLCADRGRFDLLEAVQARAVVYFDLDADSRPLLTQMLGAAIVQDLQTTVAALQGRPMPTVVVIDEFSALAAEHVVRLFGRARSAGVSLVLSSQELTDLRLPGREKLLEQVMGNLTVLLAHRQVVPESAQLIASLAGSRGAWRTSRHGDGRLTRTRTSEQVLDPSEVMRLGPGWAAAIALSAGGSARIARVFAPEDQH